MYRIESKFAVVVLIVCGALAGCKGNGIIAGGGSSGGSSGASVVLAVTDTPPSNVSLLSAKVTLTGAMLNPGNVSLFSGSTTIELTRLQTDIAYLATASNVNLGSYTSVTLTFANPTLTIENDTTNPIVSGTTTCAIGSICTIAPTSVVNLSATINLASFTLAANSKVGLLLDINLDNLLSSALAADFKAGTTISTFTPASTGAPLVGAEDVVGVVASLDTVHNTFTLQNATGSFSLTADSTSTFFPFPSGVCATAGFACLRNNQIVSVDMGIRTDGSLLARNILFEDADNTDTEVEGMITGTNAGLQQFTIVTLSMSGTVSGLNPGDLATVHYTVAPLTPFEIDYTHADNAAVSTTGFLFAAPADLSVGQQVSIRRNSSSSGTSINADRVRLRSSRISATVQTIGSPYIYLYNLPSLFSGKGVTQIQVQTTPQTIISENSVAINFSQVFVSGVVSVRGPLFNVSGTRNLIATKVVVKP